MSVIPTTNRTSPAGCALDDMSEENGTVHLLPYSRSGIRSWVHHIVEEGSNDKVGYFGKDPGLIAEVPAGSIVAFSSIVFHSSSHQHHPKTAPRVPGPILLRTYPIIRR